MKAILTLAISTALFSFAANAQEVTLVKKWETDTLLKTPEAVIYDAANRVIYASNINGGPWDKDGNGFISKISLTGKIEQLQWVTGFDAPKGLGIYKGKLYVANITNVVIVDINSGKVEKSIEVPGAKQLNDVTVDEKGKVYISDSGNKSIYILENDKVSLWLESKSFNRLNGVLALKTQLRLVDSGDGTFYTINYSDKSFKSTAKGLVGGDGIVEIAPDEYIVSKWDGEVNHVKADQVKKILDTKAAKQNAADIWYIAAENLVLVPTFFANTIAAYQLKKN